MQPQRGALCAQRRGLFCVVLLAVRSPRARSPLAGAQRGVWRTWRVWQALACAPRPVCGGCLSDALCAGSATLSLVLGLLLAYYGSHGVSLSGAKVRRASALATSDDVGGSVCALLCVHSAAHASVASRVSRCRPPCCVSDLELFVLRAAGRPPSCLWQLPSPSLAPSGGRRRVRVGGDGHRQRAGVVVGELHVPLEPHAVPLVWAAGAARHRRRDSGRMVRAAVLLGVHGCAPRRLRFGRA